MRKADATPRATAKRPAAPKPGQEPAVRPSVVIPVDPKLVSSRVRPHAPKAPKRSLWSRHVAVAAAVIATLATGLFAVRPLGVHPKISGRFLPPLSEPAVPVSE